MTSIEQRFARLSTDHAPGQELRQAGPPPALRGAALPGTPVDFSHGDVNMDAFEPTPGSFESFAAGVRQGGSQAYTEYRGAGELRDILARRLGAFTGAPIDAERELIITPGTQGALFLATASCATAGDKVAIVQPDYFANRKLVEFLGAQVMPVQMAYHGGQQGAGLDLSQLEAAFQNGATTFLFSNPNNPAGVVYTREEILAIVQLANRFGAAVIVDQLYSRLLYPGSTYTHLRASGIDADRVVTIMGPSKTESLSGYRLGVAFGAPALIDRMEKLQAIVSLRAPGYSQAVLKTWFDEPAGWLERRIEQHREIRDDVLAVLRDVEGIAVRTPQAGSYLFPRLPRMDTSMTAFVRVLREQASVTVTPGTEFSPHATDSIRLNFSQNRSSAVHAVERLATLVTRYRRSEGPQ